MNRNRAIDSQLIKNAQRSNASSISKIFLIDLIKSYLTELNVPFVDDCCEGEYSLPLRYNDETDAIEYYDPGTDTWIATIPNQYLMQFSLQNFEGDTDVDYPLGVFSVNNAYIGLATTPEEYITLWNSNVDNQAVGEIISGAGTTFVVAVPFVNSPNVNLYGLEYYTFRSSSINPVVHVVDQDVVVCQNIAYLGSSGVNTASSAKSEYNGTFGVATDTAFSYRNLIIPTSAFNVDINVFHNRLSEHVGMNTLTSCIYLGGILPAACKTFTVRTPVTIDLVTNVTNWNELTTLETFNLVNLGGIPYSIATPSFIPAMPSTLVSLGLADIEATATPNLFPWLTAASLPNLRRLKIGGNLNDIITPAAAWFATAPPVDKQLLLTNNDGAVCNTATSDIVINNLWIALAAVTAVTPASLRLENVSARSAASDTSYNNLVSAGWAVALT